MTVLSRRRLLATAAVSGVLGAAAARIGGADHDPTEAGGWRHPQATPGNTAAVDVAGPQSADGVAWRRTVDDEVGWRRSGLALSGDTLVVRTHRRLLGVSTDGEDRWTGDIASRSRFDDYAQIDSDPRVFRNRCFVASLSSLYALDVTNGRPRWRYDVDGSLDGVVLLGTTLYLTARVDDELGLLAVDATSGHERWRTDEHLVPLAATDDSLIAAEYDGGRLHGLDPATGQRRWRSEQTIRYPSLRHGSVALADETVWLLRNGTITAVDATAGTERWTADLHGDGSSWSQDRLAVADDVYVVEPDADRLSAFSRAGDRRWDRSLAGAAHGVAVGSETVYAATSRGLEAVDPADGSRRFRVSPATSAGDSVTPLVADGAVFHVAGDTLYGVRES